MALKIKINGQEYTNFQQANVIADVGAVTRAFTFSSTADSQNTFPVKVNDLVEVTADSIDILKGYVETLNVMYDGDSHSIDVGGRSILADLVDSTVSTSWADFDGTSLTAIAKTVMSDLGLKPKIINDAGSISPFDDVTSASIGQKAFDFLESSSRNMQGLWTTDGNESLVFARAGSGRAPTNLAHIIGSEDNNILSAVLSIDNSNRFNKYTVKSELDGWRQSITNTPEQLSNQSGEAIDAGMPRTTRRLEINAEESMDSFSAGDRAAWEANIRRAGSINYMAIIAGHSVDGVLWLPNTIVSVSDDFTKIYDDLLIRKVIYNYSIIEGSKTSLHMTYKDAFTLEIEQSQRDANTEEVGDEYIF